jgi:hypothetical protein
MGNYNHLLGREMRDNPTGRYKYIQDEAQRETTILYWGERGDNSTGRYKYVVAQRENTKFNGSFPLHFYVYNPWVGSNKRRVAHRTKKCLVIFYLIKILKGFFQFLNNTVAITVWFYNFGMIPK